MESIRADFVVVGAGFAGLQAAVKLREAGKTVVVLEAASRVGGRAHSRVVDEALTVDFGVGWFTSAHERLSSLARAHGIEATEAHGPGTSLHVTDQGAERFYGSFPTLDALSIGAVPLALLRFDALARTVPTDAPWRAPDAEALDGQTLGSYIARALPSGRARALAHVVLRAALGCEPGELSLLHALALAHGAGGVRALLFAQLGAERRRLRVGAQTLAERMAASLGPSVQTGATVRTLVQEGAHVVARADACEVRAGRALLALPPAQAARIAYEPALPPGRAQLLQRVPQGASHSCVAVYDRPFWRDRGHSGHALSARGPVQVTHDVSPRGDGRGVLLGVAGGSEARTLARLAPVERRARVLDAFARAHGEGARTPQNYLEKSWPEDPIALGSPAFFPPGVWCAHGPELRAPVGRLHFASAETATRWAGHLEGALEAGERAARELLRASAA